MNLQGSATYFKICRKKIHAVFWVNTEMLTVRTEMTNDS